VPTREKVTVNERERVKKQKKKTLDDHDKPGSTSNLAANHSGRAGLKQGGDVAVEEDHRGGIVSQESDVTSITIGRKGTVVYC
jgi:hypothetical protein